MSRVQNIETSKIINSDSGQMKVMANLVALSQEGKILDMIQLKGKL